MFCIFKSRFKPVFTIWWFTLTYVYFVHLLLLCEASPCLPLFLPIPSLLCSFPISFRVAIWVTRHVVFVFLPECSPGPVCLWLFPGPVSLCPSPAGDAGPQRTTGCSGESLLCSFHPVMNTFATFCAYSIWVESFLVWNFKMMHYRVWSCNKQNIVIVP